MANDDNTNFQPGAIIVNPKGERMQLGQDFEWHSDPVNLPPIGEVGYQRWKLTKQMQAPSVTRPIVPDPGLSLNQTIAQRVARQVPGPEEKYIQQQQAAGRGAPGERPTFSSELAQQQKIVPQAFDIHHPLSSAGTVVSNWGRGVLQHPAESARNFATGIGVARGLPPFMLSSHPGQAARDLLSMKPRPDSPLARGWENLRQKNLGAAVGDAAAGAANSFMLLLGARTAAGGKPRPLPSIKQQYDDVMVEQGANAQKVLQHALNDPVLRDNTDIATDPVLSSLKGKKTATDFNNVLTNAPAETRKSLDKLTTALSQSMPHEIAIETENTLHRWMDTVQTYKRAATGGMMRRYGSAWPAYLGGSVIGTLISGSWRIGQLAGFGALAAYPRLRNLWNYMNVRDIDVPPGEGFGFAREGEGPIPGPEESPTQPTTQVTQPTTQAATQGPARTETGAIPMPPSSGVPGRGPGGGLPMPPSSQPFGNYGFNPATGRREAGFRTATRTRTSRTNDLLGAVQTGRRTRPGLTLTPEEDVALQDGLRDGLTGGQNASEFPETRIQVLRERMQATHGRTSNVERMINDAKDNPAAMRGLMKVYDIAPDATPIVTKANTARLDQLEQKIAATQGRVTARYARREAERNPELLEKLMTQYFGKQ